MKKYQIYFAAVVLITMMAACSKDWFDVNTDPNNPSSASPELVLPSASVALSVEVGGYYNIIGGMWSQYWTQSAGSNQYKNIDSYQLASNDFQNDWLVMYDDAFKNFKYVKETAATNKNWSYVFMATVLESYGYQVIADLYDQVPFNEAIQGVSNNNTQPHFDKGTTVYDSIASRLERLFSLDLSTPLSADQKSKDVVFGGDMDQWKAFANTLLLKIYMRQMYARPQVAQTGIAGLYARNATFLASDAKISIFVDQPNKSNPMYQQNITGLNTSVNLRSSATLYKYFVANNDPRLPFIDGLAPDGKSRTPVPQGSFSVPDFNNPASLAATSVIVQHATDPVYFMSAAESYFLQAEAVAKGWGTGGNDKVLYDAGVKASFEQVLPTTSKPDSVAQSKTKAGEVYEYPASGSFEAKQKAIIIAKWASFAGTEGMESFFETNRTHYPSVTSKTYITATDTTYINWKGGELMYSLAGVTGGQFPKRLLFPSYETDRNPNTPPVEPVTKKVWWDVKP